MEVRTGWSPTAAAPVGASTLTNGRSDAIAGVEPRRRSARTIVIPILVVVVALIGVFGYRYFYNSSHFVYTDNASVAGSIIQVGSLNAGQVSAVLTDVGQKVQKDQVVARVTVGQT